MRSQLELAKAQGLWDAVKDLVYEKAIPDNFYGAEEAAYREGWQKGEEMREALRKANWKVQQGHIPVFAEKAPVPQEGLPEPS